MYTTNLIEGTDIEPGAEGNVYTEFAKAALADGYRQCRSGVWGSQQQPYSICPDTRKGIHTGVRHEGDRTISLYKDDVVIYLVDRDATMGRETWTSAWTQHGQRAIKLPEVYSAEAIEAARGICSKCGQGGDPARLKHFRFAEKLCPECDTPEYRAAGEFNGWCD